MFKLVRRLIMLAAIGGAVSYFIRRRKQDDLWDADEPEGDWGVEQTHLSRSP
jgi:hypothetical protein